MPHTFKPRNTFAIELENKTLVYLIRNCNLIKLRLTENNIHMKAARYFEGVSYMGGITRPFVGGKGREEYNNGHGGKGEEITDEREGRG